MEIVVPHLPFQDPWELQFLMFLTAAWLSSPRSPGYRLHYLQGWDTKRHLVRGHVRDLGSSKLQRDCRRDIKTAADSGLGPGGRVAPLPSSVVGPGVGEGGKALTSTRLTLLQVLIIAWTLSRGHQEVICVLGR